MPGWQTARVFLSSTFRDMHAERDHLVKVTFPALRERLLPFRVELYDVDLRWGITEAEAQNGRAVRLCLEQVDECRPFFLAFVGHRYGWVPDALPADVRVDFPALADLDGVSVTELEIRHGALDDPAARRALVLLRADSGTASVPATTRQRDFVESDPALQAKIAALRAMVRTGPTPMAEYPASWDAERPDRVNPTRGMLSGLDEFGRRVEDWLWQAIRDEFGLPDEPPAVDPRDAEADLHDRFLELRTRVYIGRDDLDLQLRKFALSDGPEPMILTGESGRGKSAALARFVRDFRRDHLDVHVIPHFVGASPRTTSLPGMLGRLTDELQHRFDITLPPADSPEAVLQNFAAAVLAVPASARVVLVFDALNQLDADRRAETLVWLPGELPGHVRVIASAATGPGREPRVLTAFGDRPHVRVEVQPLTDADRAGIIRAVPKLVAKTLDDAQVAALVANPATRNPLYLMVALEELRGYGSFEQLSELIAAFPQ